MSRTSYLSAFTEGTGLIAYLPLIVLHERNQKIINMNTIDFFGQTD